MLIDVLTSSPPHLNPLWLGVPNKLPLTSIPSGSVSLINCRSPDRCSNSDHVWTAESSSIRSPFDLVASYLRTLSCVLAAFRRSFAGAGDVSESVGYGSECVEFRCSCGCFRMCVKATFTLRSWVFLLDLHIQSLHVAICSIRPT
jgi:hypothetical protein